MANRRVCLFTRSVEVQPHSDDIIRSLEQNGRLLHKSAILF